MTVLPAFQSLLDRMTAAYRVGDAAACAAMFTPDAQLHSPYAPPAIGRAAIEALHTEWVGDGVEDKELRVIEAGGSGVSAWSLNRYTEHGGQIQGTSLIVWQLEADGEWRVRMCSLNTIATTGHSDRIALDNRVDQTSEATD
jgi:ketosteroid isomerase-like protein